MVIWLMAFAIPVYQGSQLIVIPYLLVCALEIYIFKYMIIDYETLESLDNLAANTYGQVLKIFLP